MANIYIYRRIWKVTIPSKKKVTMSPKIKESATKQNTTIVKNSTSLHIHHSAPWIKLNWFIENEEVGENMK
jgi:hypothetical protein